MTTKLGKNFDTSKALKSLVRGYKLVPHIDRFLPTWDEEGFTYTSARKEVDDAWHPSSDCTPGLNELYHKAITPAEPRRLAPSTVKTFQVGHFWHQWLQWIVVEKLGFASWDHVERRGAYHWGGMTHERMWGDGPTYIPLDQPGKHLGPKPWHWATGSADIAPVTIPEHGEYLVDFKTMAARLYNQENIPEYYADKWECQVNVYMDFFDLDKGLVVAICKDSQHELKEFEFRRNQPLIDAIYEKWALVSDCIADGYEPPAELDYPLPLKGTSK